jgi:hypothetical protein
MAKPKLPDYLRERIKYLFRLQHSNEDVLRLVRGEGLDYVASEKELLRCISSLKGKANKGEGAASPILPKSFDTKPYSNILETLDDKMPGKELERLCKDIGKSILRKYEKFTWVSEGPNFRGTPFDFFGFKGGDPYAIEFKASLISFHYPGETQKMRLQELRKRISGLNIALLQVKVREGKYRIFYNEELDTLFYGPKASFAPIEKWIMSRLK